MYLFRADMLACANRYQPQLMGTCSMLMVSILAVRQALRGALPAPTRWRGLPRFMRSSGIGSSPVDIYDNPTWILCYAVAGRDLLT